jgi:hypothetical protein
MSDQAKVVLSGRIKTIFSAEVFGNFEKRVMWLEEQTDKYPQTYSLEFTQGDVNVLDAFKEGDQVECSINLRGRHSEKNGKEYVFNSMQCWRIKRVANAVETPTQVQQTAPVVAPVAQELTDELPF